MTLDPDVLVFVADCLGVDRELYVLISNVQFHGVSRTRHRGLRKLLEVLLIRAGRGAVVNRPPTSYVDLANAMECSERTARSYVQLAEQYGVIQVTRNRGYQQEPNVYEVVPRALMNGIVYRDKHKMDPYPTLESTAEEDWL